MSYETVFAALSNPVRRSILERLRDNPSSVRSLADQFPHSQPAISQHLKTLKDAGLVGDTAEGTRRIYRVRPEGMRMLKSYLEQHWQTFLLSLDDNEEDDQTDD
ncbi:MAG: metalloregulator ArsR/SmtB family transcription factor [Alphaproteobacteria bacterium]|nr:metalloregulator ArsR/SmtB family transcription factor [Alphaproteobacteria bacterium]